MPTNIEALINTIPTAEDDHVITSDHYNKLLAAIKALAGLGNTSGVQQQVSILSPAFFADGTNPTWPAQAGIVLATGPAKGWMPALLPDGAVIEKLVVRCRRVPSTGLLRVGLFRQPIISEILTAVATTEFAAETQSVTGVPAGPPDPFAPFTRATVPNRFTSIGIGTTILPGTFNFEELDLLSKTEEGSASAAFNTVDNRLYKYLIYASLDATPPPGTGNPPFALGSTQIRGIQIFYSLS